MSGFYTVAVTVCAAAIACAILSTFVSDGGLKRILSLVMGAFMVCSLIVPAKNAVQKLGLNLSSYPSSQQLTATADKNQPLRDYSVKSAAKPNNHQQRQHIYRQEQPG